MPDIDVISALNELIKVSKDCQKSFLEAERLVSDPDLKLMFRRFSDDCANAANDFEACAVTAGGYPDNVGSATGAIHRELMNLKASVLPNEESTVLRECEGEEDRAKAVYETIMKTDLPPAVRTIVEKQYAETLDHRLRIRLLRDRYENTA